MTRLFVHPTAARSRFREHLALPEENFDLVRASLLIALEEYPSLDIEQYLRLVRAWSDAIRSRIADLRDVEDIISEINHLMFDEEGFRGETEDYYDPRNALLNDVLDEHRGIAVSLTILYMALLRNLGAHASGVSLPGRTLVRMTIRGKPMFIDPFDGGRVLTRSECQRILDHFFGGAVTLRDAHLRTISKREVIVRLLAHLKSAYLAKDDLKGAISAIDRILIIDEKDAYETRDRGFLALQMHRYGEAIRYLERYLALAPHAEDTRSTRGLVDYVRSWLERN